MKSIEKIFTYFPLSLIIAKKLSKKFGLGKTFKKSVLSKDVKNIETEREKLFSRLNNLDINKGDILVLHSSYDEIGKLGITPDEIIDYFLSRIGEEGTLVMPAYPLYLNKDKEFLKYNVKFTPCWTGIIPQTFLSKEGVTRSPFPYNSLAAYGAKAEEMMKNNLESDTAFGPNSAWAYCYYHDAKVICLGVPPNHSLSAPHIAEDLMEEEWPIKNFHEEKKFKIKTEDKVIDFKARIKRSYWFDYTKTYNSMYQYRKHGYLFEYPNSGTFCAFVPSIKNLVDFVISKAKKGKTIYWVWNKYKK